MHAHLPSGVFPQCFGCRAAKGGTAARDAARELMHYVRIDRGAGELARNLSHGDQRRLEIARALALRPKVLLVDEPTAGMNPHESGQFNDFVNRVRNDYDLSVLLIEHDMSVIMRISERITVLDHGRLIAEGSPEQIRSDQTVIEAYLGRAGAREDRRNRS